MESQNPNQIESLELSEAELAEIQGGAISDVIPSILIYGIPRPDVLQQLKNKQFELPGRVLGGF